MRIYLLYKLFVIHENQNRNTEFRLRVKFLVKKDFKFKHIFFL